MKASNLFKNKFLILGSITFLAFLIRLLNIDKSLGLWYDEMLTYIFSSKGSVIEITKALLKEDFHMPLYYFFVGGWMKFFGTSDVILRLSSIFWGVLTIPAFFYLGKTYRDEKLGWFLSIIGCLSPIMIYYSQELRFYSMLMFFSTLTIIFLLKLLDVPSKKNLFMFGTSNLIILYIYTMGSLFIGLEFFVLLIHFYLYKKDYLIRFLKFCAIFFVLALPYFGLLISYLKASSQTILPSFAWGQNSKFSPIFLINDWLSPAIMGQYGQNDTIIKSVMTKPNYIYSFLSLSATSICFLIGFFSSLKNRNRNFIYLLSIIILFWLAEIMLTLKGNLVIVTRYTLILLPLILLVCTDGLTQIKNVLLKAACITIILTIFIYNSLSYKVMPSFGDRMGGYKYITDQIELLKPENDYIIYVNRSELLEKYLNTTNYIKFDIPQILYLDKTKTEALKNFDENFVKSTTTKNSDKKLIPYILNSEPNNQLKTYLNQQITKIPKGKKLIFIDDFIILNANLRNDFIKKYQAGEISQKDYKEMLFYFTYAKMIDDIKKVLEENKSVKNLNTSHNIKNNKFLRWHYIIYKKI